MLYETDNRTYLFLIILSCLAVSAIFRVHASILPRQKMTLTTKMYEVLMSVQSEQFDGKWRSNDAIECERGSVRTSIPRSDSLPHKLVCKSLSSTVLADPLYAFARPT